MTTKECKRKHTPIVSEKQRGKFGAEYQRRKEGKKSQIPSITTKDLRKHLKEAKGKDLPESVGRKRKRETRGI